MSGWGDQLLQADIDQQYITHDPPGPHSNFDFTYGHQLDDHGTYQTQSAWLPPQPQLPHAQHHGAPIPLASSTQAASHHSSWAPHQHWQGSHGPDDQGQSYWQPLPSGQGLPQPVIAHPVPQRLYYQSGPQRFFAAWQPSPSPTAHASSPLLGPTHQPDQNDGSQSEAPVPSVNPFVFDNTSYHPTPSSPSRSSHQIFNDISQHAALTAPRRRRRGPQEQTSSRSAKRTKTQTRSSTQFTIIPYRSEMVLDRCIHSMKLTAFKTSLLPLDIDRTVDASCRAVAGQQTDGMSSPKLQVVDIWTDSDWEQRHCGVGCWISWKMRRNFSEPGSSPNSPLYLAVWRRWLKHLSISNMVLVSTTPQR